MSFNTAKHYILSTLLLLALSFNQGLGTLSSASAMSNMQSFADADTLAICTGTRVKWISAAIFYRSGDIVEVAAPNKTPDNLHDVSCVLAQLNDLPKNDKFATLNTFKIAFVGLVVSNAKRLFATIDCVNNFLARAPPAFL